MSKHQLETRIKVANKTLPADLVVKNANIINVFTKEFMSGDIAITDGKVVGIGEYKGIEEIDAEGRFACPGLIDAHVHIESSMVTPQQFARIVVPHGVTTVITDPHEIANVCGTDGLDFMLKDSAETSLDILVMLPSCVPATEHENSGALLTAADLQPFLPHPRVIGLAEVMDFPAVLRADSDMLDKLKLTRQIDGHGAGLKENDINVYRASGILTDHECVTPEEVLVRLRRGMYVMLREGSAAKNLQTLLAAVTEQNAHRCLFCTDDKHLDDLIEEGSIDYNIRVAIKYGLDPITAISMATLNAAQCYGLHSKGAIAPGYDADFLLLDSLEEFSVSHVYKGGVLAAENGQYHRLQEKLSDSDYVRGTIRLAPFQKENLQIPMNGKIHANIMEIIPNSLITEHRIQDVTQTNGMFIADMSKDLLKAAVFERHHATGNIGLGIVKGLGLKAGALATTVAHDSHNIIAVGTNDDDILTAVEAVKRMGGGSVVALEGEVLAGLPLPIAGLMSDLPYEEVYEQVKQVDAALQKIGAPTAFNIFLTLSFLSLPVIPHLKLTDLGLFDVSLFQHIDIPVEPKVSR
ncbi:MAG TPA: adenine deaminase [Planococcus sp. (in: firmicutes)]|nr:adenine deaminase [Planococcus sp. (in: firmicutes)]